MTAAEAWFVCHTRPRCEKKFAALLTAEGLEHYLPLVESARRYGTRTKRFSRPLFPGYVFARVRLETKTRIYQQDLLARVIPVADEARLLRQLAEVRAIVGSGYAFTVEGVIDDASDPEAVVIAVDVLRQGLQVRVPAADVRPLP